MSDPTGSGTILDIGANSGDFAVAAASRNPAALVIAVEPVAELAQEIRRRAEDAGLTNLTVAQVAIAAQPGKADMNVSTEGDRGTSSLLSFDEALIGRDEYWSTRQDLSFSTTDVVEVVTLEDLLREQQRQTVDFVKIDAQGKDLEALLSAGSLLGGIRAGMLEASSTAHTRLYAGEPTLREVLERLDAAGFDVHAIKPNDPASNEVNVFFSRKGEALPELEESLGLRGIELYDGKHFWGRPAASMQEVQAADVRATEQDNRTAALEARVRELEARLAIVEPVASPGSPTTEPAAPSALPDDATPEELRRRLRVVETELARYHAVLGLPEDVTPRRQESSPAEDIAHVTATDVLARWAESARELDELRRTTALLTERERRATMALRKARQEQASATAAQRAMRAQVDDMHRELGRMRSSASWRLTAPLRTGMHRLRRVVHDRRTRP